VARARERSRGVQNTELRPLGAGEMLDRAITLFVRRFAAIVAVLAVVSVPIVVLQALAAPHAGQVFADMARVLGAAGNPAASRAAADAMTRDDRTGPLTVIVLLVAALVRPVMWAALVALLAGAYAGVETSIGDAYRFGLRRWFPLILVALTYLVLGGFAAIPILIVYVLVLLAVVALSALHSTVALVVVGVIGVVFVLALASVIGSLVLMAYELSAVAIVTETASPIEAIGIGMRRAFAPGMKRRTVVGGLVVLLVSQVGSIPLIGVAAVVSAATHVDALYFAIFGAGTILLEGIVAAFVVVFAVDARVRREGYDLVLPETPPVPA
jgi:hypothetical protein